MTSKKVMDGAVGSRPMSFSATITCAELETGSNSQKPCTTAKMNIFMTIGTAAPNEKRPGRREAVGALYQ
jgi:hypothetical protein